MRVVYVILSAEVLKKPLVHGSLGASWKTNVPSVLFVSEMHQRMNVIATNPVLTFVELLIRAS